MPTVASSQPASANASRNFSGSASASGSRNFSVNSYSLMGVRSLRIALCPDVRATIHDSPQEIGMVAGILRRTPNGGAAEFITAAGLVVVRTEHLSPCMGTALFDQPAMRLCMANRVL